MLKTHYAFRLLIIAFTVMISFGIDSSVFAHKGATGVVKQRMDTMKEMKSQLKQIDEMLEGKKDYNEQKIRKSLSYIRDQAGENMTKLFPKGTAHKPSEADPVIWKNWSEFAKMALQLSRSTDGFQAKLPEGKAVKQSIIVLKDSYLSLRKVCKSCHDQFRE